MNFGSRPYQPNLGEPWRTLADVWEIDLPAANGPEIHVDKLRLGIVAHTAAMQTESCVTQTSGRNAWHANVDRFAEHVLAVLGNTDGGATQKFIAPRRTVAANDVDLSAGMAYGGGQITEQIEKAWIEIGDVTGAVIAQEMIEFVHGIGEIRISLAIDDIDALIRVQMKKQQAMLSQGQIRGGGESSRKNQKNNKQKRKRKNTAWKHLVILARGHARNS